MFARLGFALAVNVDPEILLIDEILAVGDEAFQQKCLDRFRTFREQGVTMLFVTHDTDLASTICDELVVLDRGRMIAHGDPVEAATIYRRHLYGEDSYPEPVDKPPASGVRFDRLRLLVDGRTTTTVRADDTVTIAVDISADEQIHDLVVAYAIRDASRSLVNSSNTEILGLDLCDFSDKTTIYFTFDGLPLLNGLFDVDLGAHSSDGSRHFAQIDTAGRFTVHGSGLNAGVAKLPVRATQTG